MTEDNLGPAQVLVADDKAFIRNLIQSALLRCGDIDVVQASNGEEAAKLLLSRGKQISCVFADWNMQPMDGLTLLRTIRLGQLREVDRGLPFVMLTGHADRPIVEAAGKLDVSGYLVKPVSFSKLKATLAEALNTPVRLKKIEHYKQIAPPEIPDELKDGDTRKTAWVVWNRDRYKAKQAAEALDQVQHEAKTLITQNAKLKTYRNKRLLALEKVEPGLVLAEDIVDIEGNALLKAGMVLSASLLSRLGELAAGHDTPVNISVGDPEVSS